ncbi:cell growth regulator with RING finger domain protein 1-like isoform X2 [Apostichopus japonicus]|uniref:cell growth regulator with RING finger domain protein 1-like isoform X2 n=1 Tax=Stichopus japonicus TaxID=307972 RepID=UPI003AB398FF
MFAHVVLLAISVAYHPYRIFKETSSTLQLQIPELSMVVAKNPFQVEFPQLERATIKDGISMKVKVEEPVEVVSYWGASCLLFIHALNHDPGYLLSQDMDLQHVDHKSFKIHPGQEEVFKISPDCPTDDLNFGLPPRVKYPLVILTRCLDRSQENQDSAIVGGVWILHLPDASFDQPGHVISQLVITNHGQVHNLQKMYVAADAIPASEQEASTNTTTTSSSSEEQTPPSEEGFHTLTDGHHDCAVCQNGAITRVILPCRHACLCEDCFKLVTKCPMCRGPVVSHFGLHHQEMQQEVGVGISEISDSWVGYLVGLSDRLNRRLGYT